MGDYTYLLPEPPEGYYWKYCCQQTEWLNGCHESVCACDDWTEASPPSYSFLPAHYNSTCNDCSITSSSNEHQIRWNECRPGIDPEWFEYHTVMDLYEVEQCLEIDVPLPIEEIGFSYSEPWRIYDENSAANIQICADLNGEIETGLVDCVEVLRCKSKYGFSYDDEWISDKCIRIEGPTSINCFEENKYQVALKEYDEYSNLIDYAAPEDIDIFLSYTGSTLTRNVGFTAPSQLKILKGQSKIEFDIATFDGSGKILILISSEYNECISFEINVECDVSSIITNRSSCADLGFFWDPYGHIVKTANIIPPK